MILQKVREIAPGIVQNPGINSGRPVIEGTRIFVDLILGYLEVGMSSEEIKDEFDLTSEQLASVQRLSAEKRQYIQGYADALENNSIKQS